MSKRVFDVDTMPVEATAVVLEESDFLSQQAIDDGSIEPPEEAAARDWIGLEVSFKKRISIETKFKLAEMTQLTGKEEDIPLMLKAGRDVAALFADTIVSWGMLKGGRPLEINAASILSLDDSFMVALQKLFGKIGQGQMSPNS